MAKFKQVPQSFLFEKLVRFWGNMVKNYQGIVCDEDFFRVLNRHFEHAKAVKLIEATYSPDEIKNMAKGRSRCNRLDLEDPLDEMFRQLWNSEKKQVKCRAILAKIQEKMLAHHPRSQNEPLEKRFLELKRIFRLTDLEYDILLAAYVYEETCFNWPRRIEDREKPLYFAMALDRSYGEVLKAMTPKGALRKFELLDEDWDFSSRSVGGYLDGSDSETIERRFYRRNEMAEVLPWDFYGDLAKTDGAVLKRMLSSRPRKCNILLYGAPGTGKTSFARTLAKELGRTAWEIAQVNELLQQMENFNGVMIAATNFCANLDAAIMRRFTFKLEFDYLDDAGKQHFFERLFKTKLTDDEFADLKTLRNLAPGDFRTVRQKTFYLNAVQTNTDRIAALKDECALKKDGNKSAKIGF